MYFTYVRPIKNWWYNWWFRRRRKPLPIVKSIEHASLLVVENVQWVKDATDWQKHPELTWGDREGDCEDISKLCAFMIKPFVSRCRILNFMADNWGHAICWYPKGVLNNGRLEYTTEDWGKLAIKYGGDSVKRIIVENPYTGKIEEEIKCQKR